MPNIDAASIALAYLAGLLATLSPCVLPLLPILVAAALAEHRHGLFVLALGLTLSFASVGLFLATVGLAIGLDGQTLRLAAAIGLIVFGALLLWPRLNTRFEQATARVGSVGSQALARLHDMNAGGWPGQFVIGLLLGLVWTPCVGPTLGAATMLAVQRTQLGGVTLVLLAFGLGASTPMVILGRLSSATLKRWRQRLIGASGNGRRLLGAVTLALGALVVVGWDKKAEAVLLQVLPRWLGELATRY